MNKKILWSIIWAIAFILAIVFYGWKLAIIILLAIWGNNLERNNK